MIRLVFCIIYIAVYKTRHEPNVRKQCDQIGQFSEGLGDNFPCNNSSKILKFFWAIWEVSLSEYNLMWLLSGQLLVYISLLFVPSSGHTVLKQTFVITTILWSRHEFVVTSVTRWQNYFFTIWPFKTMNNSPKSTKFAVESSKFCEILNKPV